MISVDEAISLLKNNKIKLYIVNLPILECLNHYSAEDIIAPINEPNFDNSAMDGYCFNYQDYLDKKSLRVTNIIEAGNTDNITLKEGECARIFTGAMIPKNADTVIPQEDVEIINGILHFKKEIFKGKNIRKKGNQHTNKELILKKNTKITSNYISYLATFGINKLSVFRKPVIGVMVTGGELINPPHKLKDGQIYDSNSVSILAELKTISIDSKFTIKLSDNKKVIEEGIRKNIEKVDILIITGGISVGDYDFVRTSFSLIGGEEIFYKVKHKPGKPFYFGKYKNTIVFGLPGNPASVLTCYYVYIKPYIKSIMGEINSFKNDNKAILKEDYIKKGEFTNFFKAYLKNNIVEILDMENPHKMENFKMANCFVVAKENQYILKKGQEVEIILF